MQEVCPLEISPPRPYLAQWCSLSAAKEHLRKGEPSTVPDGSTHQIPQDMEERAVGTGNLHWKPRHLKSLFYRNDQIKFTARSSQLPLFLKLPFGIKQDNQREENLKTKTLRLPTDLGTLWSARVMKAEIKQH